jgi:hypothetical protein
MPDEVRPRPGRLPEADRAEFGKRKRLSRIDPA